MPEGADSSFGVECSSFCSACGSQLPPDALYCHRCGAKVPGRTESPPSAVAATTLQDHFDLGVLLIKIGAIASFVLPLLLIAGAGTMGFPFFLPGPAGGGLFAGVISSFVILGFVFGVVAALFSRDIAAGSSKRIVHAIILAAVMFVLGSNVAGILVGIGAFLCYTSPRNRRR